jgi:IS30 family transposase
MAAWNPLIQRHTAPSTSTLSFLAPTTVNGKEFATHQDMSDALKATIFFATPYHAWERGLNENTNGLIRDFFPKGTDFSTIANAEVAKVERLLNARPRKSLGFRSPHEVFDSFAYS